MHTVHTCIPLRLNVYVYMYVCMHVCMYVCIHICVCMYKHACKHASNAHDIHTYINTYVSMQTHTYIHTCMSPWFRGHHPWVWGPVWTRSRWRLAKPIAKMWIELHSSFVITKMMGLAAKNLRCSELHHSSILGAKLLPWCTRRGWCRINSWLFLESVSRLPSAFCSADTHESFSEYQKKTISSWNLVLDKYQDVSCSSSRAGHHTCVYSFVGGTQKKAERSTV